MANLKVSGRPVRYTGQAIEDAYFCLTDMCNFGEFKERGEAKELLRRWLRARTTIEFLGELEQHHNPDFKVVEFDHFKQQAGLNTFLMSTEKWIEQTNGKALISKRGRYGGTYGHIKIAFHLANWLSPQFYFQFITSFIENNAFSVKRLWSRLNYRLHTEGVKAALPSGLTRSTKGLQYASEADLLNIA
ncbi:MAG: KilA-N domain-containing protein, partial [Bacteroidota bacterium]